MFFPFLLFILGSVIGSFLNVLVLRMRTGKTLGGRSMCMTCGKALRWYELVPILSFLVQHGRCRECHSKISAQYVLVEFFTAVLFLLVGVFLWNGGIDGMSVISLVLNLFIMAVLVSIFVYDYLHQIIPDQFVIALVAVGFLQTALSVVLGGKEAMLFLTTFVDGLILFTPFFLLWFFSKGRWIGFGDGKLAFAIGTIMPLAQGISAIVLSFWIGALAGIMYMYVNKLQGKNVSHVIPFGPFMVLGVIITLFFPLDLFNVVLLSEYVKTIF